MSISFFFEIMFIGIQLVISEKRKQEDYCTYFETQYLQQALKTFSRVNSIVNFQIVV